MIDVKNITFSYRKENVLDNISCIFEQGKIVSILGRNGSGKSTLLKNITKLLKPAKGTIYLDGKDIQIISAKETAKEMAFLSQRSSGIDATVRDAVLTGRKPHMGMNVSENDRSVVAKTLKLMKLDHLACRHTTEISGGELQKVVIARALVQEPRVLLLDEPVNHLDMVNQLEVLSMIRDITKDRNLTTAIVMHDINTAIRFSDSLIFMKGGKIEGICGVDEITTELISNTYGLKVEIINDKGRVIVTPI